jgi:choline dehydrogenase-like flavoprotein
MIIDFREPSAPTVYQVDLCLIGGGVANLSIARRLLAQGHSVFILESGGTDYDEDVQAMADARNVGFDYYTLRYAALRMLGGTTAIWGGRCCEYDPIDFEARAWVPHSGWPFGKTELEPYYREAARWFEIKEPSPMLNRFRQAVPVINSLDDGAFTTGIWVFDDEDERFTGSRIADVVDHPKTTIVLHATVTSINAAHDAGSIESLTIRDLSGRSGTVRAKRFVLGVGGLQNPRLLLASNDVMTCGLGNQNDLVGRFFMEHPHARGGKVVSDTAAWNLMKAFGRSHVVDGQRVAAGILPKRDAQARHGLLNTAISITPRQPPTATMNPVMKVFDTARHTLDPNKLNRSLWRSAKGLALWAHQFTDPLRPWVLMKMGQRDMAIMVRAEQAPNPDSRVSLIDERDPLGVPKYQLDWRFADLDKHTVKVIVEQLDAHLRATDRGHVEMEDWLSEQGVTWKTDALISTHPYGGFHHVGTTKMADDPKQGVVDRHGKVHGLANLYITGCSVFPTASWVNPTFTIMAMAFRLADHLMAQPAA